MFALRVGGLVLAAWCAASCQRSYDPTRELSDGQLRAMAQQRISDREINKIDQVVGLHHGTPVRMTVRCGDLCPDYAVRIIRYDIEAKDCARAGGVLRRVGVPGAASVMLVDLCIPATIASDPPLRYR